MAKKRLIHIDIMHGTGEVKITTEGFVGKSCVDETKFLEQILGKKTIEVLTPAYYVKERVHTKEHLPLCG